MTFKEIADNYSLVEMIAWLFSEVAEFQQALMREIPYSKEHVIEEAGDCLNLLLAILTQKGMTMSDLMEAAILKGKYKEKHAYQTKQEVTLTVPKRHYDMTKRNTRRNAILVNEEKVRTDNHTSDNHGWENRD